MHKELWLFTQDFPYGKGEAFLENELPVLASGFEKIRVFPLFHQGDARPVPKGVEVVRAFTREEAFRPLAAWRVPLSPFRFLKVLGMGRRTAPGRGVFRKHRAEFLSQLRQAMERERLFHLRMAGNYDPERVRLYSFWTADWATVLGLWKLRNPRVRFVSRMMGFDMYDHRAPDKWQRFQLFHVRQAEHVYVIAEAGLRHMQQRFPAQGKKFSLNYLATTDHGLAPWAPAEVLRIASCSNLVELKRVPLIAGSLRHVQGPVQWTHFGDGPERAAVEQAVAGLPGHVQVEFMGSRPNSEVIAWYKSNPVDVFVHASRTEGGAPVALQEAASFGIPLIAADAGGVREVATPESGQLLPNDLTPAMLGAALGGFKRSPWYTQEARGRVRAFWASRFEASRVYRDLLKELLGH